MMKTITEKYESCYNDIILNKVPEARESFLAAYKEHPKHLPFFHGFIISSLLLQESESLMSCLEQERIVSPHRALMNALYIFFIEHPVQNKTPVDCIYELGAFVRDSINTTDAKPYFHIGHIIAPSHEKHLIAMAEYCIREGQYVKGLHLYSQAAQAKSLH
jgi:hypothetical protein